MEKTITSVCTLVVGRRVHGGRVGRPILRERVRPRRAVQVTDYFVRLHWVVQHLISHRIRRR